MEESFEMLYLLASFKEIYSFFFFLGLRIGKGKGYADLEYAMLRTMGAIDENTPVVTSVHDSQVMDIPEDLVSL